MFRRISLNHYEIFHYDQVESTNQFSAFEDEIHLEDSTVIWADMQSKGKGRRGREWFAPPGNLYMTVYLNGKRFENPIHELSFLVSVAVYDAIVKLFPELETLLKLKWPNDLLLDQKKCAGILIEQLELSPYQDFIAVGVGLNLKHAFKGGPYPTAALSDYLYHVKEIEPYDLLVEILKHLSNLLEVWESRGFDPVLHRWERAMIHKKGDVMQVEMGQHREAVIFQHIAHDGSLMILHQGVLKKHFAGDVIL